MNQLRITSDDSWENSSKLEGYRSRYYAFLQQKTNNPSVQIQKLRHFGQGVMSIVIFMVLFIAILTLFGMGLSWYSQANLPKSEATQQNQATVSGASADELPSTAGQQAGPADARKKTRK